ncbi:hypothetical protein JCM33374_g4990 [Metschnikowia sp. JCM 33374]|nr:hypothetical protein JCM33374_g4990 [Metschnikowia sp. JCM 33374]
MTKDTGATKRTASAGTEKRTVIEIHKTKQVSVSKFKNFKMVDIREFYIDKATNEKKPTKKGISLTQEVWTKLLEKKDEIEEALAALDGENTGSDGKNTDLEGAAPKLENKSPELGEEQPELDGETPESNGKKRKAAVQDGATGSATKKAAPKSADA